MTKKLQSAIFELIQKIIERRFQEEPKEQINNRINEMREYAKYGKKESVGILSEALKLEVADYHNKIVSKKPNPKKLAHYTNMETVFSILKLQSKQEPQRQGLRLSDASYSNDPSEGDYLKDNLIKDHPWLKDSGQETDAFVCSFVSGSDEDIGDKITYWQSYGKDGLGCSIQLPQTDLLNQFEPVLYKDNFKDIIDHFKSYFKLGGLLHSQISSKEDKKYFASQFWKAFDKIKFLYKHKGYEYEKEYRFIKVSLYPKEIKEDSTIVPPYLKRYIFDEKLKSKEILASGSKIVIGPRVINRNRLRQYLKKLANKSKYYGPEFICSKIPYRKVW